MPCPSLLKVVICGSSETWVGQAKLLRSSLDRNKQTLPNLLELKKRFPQKYMRHTQRNNLIRDYYMGIFTMTYWCLVFLIGVAMCGLPLK